MVIQFGDFQVDVKAKSSITNSGKYNAEDTRAFLIYVLCALDDASCYNKMQGFQTTAKLQSDISLSVYTQLNTGESKV